MWPFIYGKILQANNKGSVKKTWSFRYKTCFFNISLLRSKLHRISPRGCINSTLLQHHTLPVTSLADRFDSPESNMGSLSTAFFTRSDSPVSDDSSTMRSLLWSRTPSAGSKSPEIRSASNKKLGQMILSNTGTNEKVGKSIAHWC